MAEQSQWETELDQLRQLMRNVVTNHDRIRDRIDRLHERYLDGEMGDTITVWESWAIAYFAYSQSYLRFLTNPHPLSLDKWARQQQRDQKKIADEKHREELRRLAHEKKLQEIETETERAREIAEAQRELKFIKSPSKARKPRKPKVEIFPEATVPTTPELAALLAQAQAAEEEFQAQEKTYRYTVGRYWFLCREIVKAGKAGDNPETDRPWKWNLWASIYIRKGRVWIFQCIQHYRRNVSSLTNSSEENVRNIRG